LQVGNTTTLNINIGSSFSGPGTLLDQATVVFGAAVSVASLQVSGSAVFNSDVSVPALALDYGTISGSGSLTVTGTFTTIGGTGTLQGPGTVTIASGANIVDSSSAELLVTGGQLVNRGTATLDSSTLLGVSNGATVTNSGSLTMESGSLINSNNYCGTTAVFANTGTIDVSPGASQTAYFGQNAGNCGLVVNNSGTIDFASGTLQVGNTTTLNINIGSSFSGPGTLLDQATVVFGAAVSVASLQVSGSAVFNSDVSVTTLQLSGTAVLTQNVDVYVTSLSVSSGTVQVVAQNAGAFGEFDVEGTATLSGSTLNVDATSFTPACGASVIAIQAASVSGPFQSVTGPVPSGGTWEPTSTSMSAGGIVYCPPG
jgi:hypothetical protein